MEATICEALESHAGIIRDPLGVKFDEAGCRPFGEIQLPSMIVKWALNQRYRSCYGTVRTIIIITKATNDTVGRCECSASPERRTH